MRSDAFLTQMKQHCPGSMEPQRQSAVLLPFVAVQGRWHLLLEERAHTLRAQPGELCLPGGGMDPGERPGQAALRECCEELLIRPEQLELWGLGDVLTTPSGRTIHTALAQLRDYAGTFSPQEVHSMFTVPVDWLLEHPPLRFDSAVTTHPQPGFPQEWVPGGENYPWSQGRWPIFFYPPYQGRRIWGITAKILLHSLELVQRLGGLPPVPGEAEP